MSSDTRFGISAALTTPYNADFRVDVEKLASHADDLLRRGCTCVTAFGTTGEGPLVSPDERDRVAAGLIRAGIPAGKLVEGVIACSIEEAAEGTARALQRGARAVLLAPPFYFREITDESAFAWFVEVFDRVGANLRDIILYHIPGMTGVPLSLDVIGQLKAAYPAAILGVKDSACDEAATMRLIAAHGDLVILVGDETYLGKAAAAGASGSICGLANIVPEAVIDVLDTRRDDPRVKSLVDAIARYPVIPMVKALVGHVRRDPSWARARPPLPTVAGGDLRTILPHLDPLRAPAEAHG